MNLRFCVNQAEALRRGIDAPDAIVTVEVNPEELSAEQRTLLADRLWGIDVCQLWNSEQGTTKQLGVDGRPILVEATAPTFEGLMDAVNRDQERVDRRQAARGDSGIDMPSAALEQMAAFDELTNSRDGNTTLSW